MDDAGPRDSEPLESGSDKLASLRARLNETETELRDLGYRTERCVAHPGSRLSGQIFDEEVLILLLFGAIRTRIDQELVDLQPGERLEIPPGVPFTLMILGDANAYWLQASRKEDLQAPQPGERAADSTE